MLLIPRVRGADLSHMRRYKGARSRLSVPGNVLLQLTELPGFL
jgi:hypothetical protein